MLHFLYWLFRSRDYNKVLIALIYAEVQLFRSAKPSRMWFLLRNNLRLIRTNVKQNEIKTFSLWKTQTVRFMMCSNCCIWIGNWKLGVSCRIWCRATLRIACLALILGVKINLINFLHIQATKTLYYVRIWRHDRIHLSNLHENVFLATTFNFHVYSQ